MVEEGCFRLDLDLEKRILLLLPDGSLFLLTTRMKETGRYQCEVITEEGIFNSREALLKVKYKSNITTGFLFTTYKGILT